MILSLPGQGLPLYANATIRVDSKTVTEDDDKPSLWWKAVLVEGFHEEFSGLVPCGTELEKGNHLGVKIPKKFQTRSSKIRRWTLRKSRQRSQPHQYYVQVC